LTGSDVTAMTVECPTAFADMANAHPIRRPRTPFGQPAHPTCNPFARLEKAQQGERFCDNFQRRRIQRGAPQTLNLETTPYSLAAGTMPARGSSAFASSGAASLFAFLRARSSNHLKQYIQGRTENENL